MKLFKTLGITLAVLLVSALSIARTADKDIVDTAVGAGKFTTLVKLVQAAGLVDTLKGEGPFTVLAPDDKAFEKFEKRYPEAFKKLGEDKELLKKVLLYHVIKGSVMAADLKDGAEVETVEGEKVTVHLQGGARFNRSKVTTADIKASNGVIHIIGSVLVPPTIMREIRKAAGN
jgi:uncharacterized surface protein with fasciclin (FAS1) repeats